jgi:hypothetical protein
MNIFVRPAIQADVREMEEMTQAKRRLYEQWQPVFHKEAPGAKEIHTEYMTQFLHNPATLALVVAEHGSVQGFLFGEYREAPPVYAPGGKILMIDDFVVKEEAMWNDIGLALLNAAKEIARKKEAALVNVVCGPKDGPKRALLLQAGLSVASEWWVQAP